MAKERTFTYREAFTEFLTPRNIRTTNNHVPFVSKKCCLCGRKERNMRGIAIESNIRVRNIKQVPTVVECDSPEMFMHLCPDCHHNVWGIFFELFNAVAKGEPKPLLDWGFTRTMELARKKYAKFLKQKYKHQKDNTK